MAAVILNDDMSTSSRPTPGHIDLRHPQSKELRPRRIPWRALGYFFLTVLVVSGGYVFYRLVPISTLFAPKTSSVDTPAVLNEVARHMILPEGVEPRIGTIRNTEEFANDPFLSRSREGDIIIFYPNDGATVKAIIYRPSLDRIVDVSLVTIPGNQ